MIDSVEIRIRIASTDIALRTSFVGFVETLVWDVSARRFFSPGACVGGFATGSASRKPRTSKQKSRHFQKTFTL